MAGCDRLKKLFCIVFAFLLSGCHAGLTVSEINLRHAEDDVLQFVETVGQENGNYLYMDDAEDMYVFLNRLYVPLGRDAVYFTDFHVTAQRNVLTMFYTQESDSDYEEFVKYQALYKIGTRRGYETIHLIGNGQPTSFDRVFHVE